jgi:uncharacterized protein (TIGR02588 family)
MSGAEEGAREDEGQGEGNGEGQGRRPSRRSKDRDRGTPERITLAIAILLLASFVGALTYLQLTAGSAAAGLHVRAEFDRAFERDGDWYLPVTVVNSGDEPTDAVLVALEREDDGEQPEVAELEFAFLAGGEEVSGRAVFDARPTRENTTVDVMSYTDP